MKMITIDIFCYLKITLICNKEIFLSYSCCSYDGYCKLYHIDVIDCNYL